MESLDSVKQIIIDELEKIGYSLHSLNYRRGKEAILEAIVDRDDPINLDDISEVSQKISTILDEHDFTNDSYTLDVSSLGAEKPIKVDVIEKYIEKYVNVHTTHPYKGLSYLEGTLTRVDDKEIELEYFVKGKKTKAILEREYIDKAHLAIKF